MVDHGTLSESDVRRIAEATAQLVLEDVEELLRGGALPPRGLLTTAQAATMLAVSEAYVRDHAAEFGAVRVGGERGPLRFEVKRLREYVERHRLTPPQPARSRRRPGQRRQVDDVELLPLPEGAE